MAAIAPLLPNIRLAKMLQLHIKQRLWAAFEEFSRCWGRMAHNLISFQIPASIMKWVRIRQSEVTRFAVTQKTAQICFRGAKIFCILWSDFVRPDSFILGETRKIWGMKYEEKNFVFRIFIWFTNNLKTNKVREWVSAESYMWPLYPCFLRKTQHGRGQSCKGFICVRAGRRRLLRVTCAGSLATPTHTTNW